MLIVVHMMDIYVNFLNLQQTANAHIFSTVLGSRIKVVKENNESREDAIKKRHYTFIRSYMY